ncbi:hypothetical protein MKZ38_009516 [Zalerion maritima]|uniref:Uncharacterized protein n=1 Tax=Zalerion maritima TaxID=339359 RepID=A0AAD5RU48_9PEZI|nr:hypothetical protein MKZ38_009516 [Zalerion maritima]
MRDSKDGRSASCRGHRGEHHSLNIRHRKIRQDGLFPVQIVASARFPIPGILITKRAITTTLTNGKRKHHIHNSKDRMDTGRDTGQYRLPNDHDIQAKLKGNNNIGSYRQRQLLYQQNQPQLHPRPVSPYSYRQRPHPYPYQHPHPNSGLRTQSTSFHTYPQHNPHSNPYPQTYPPPPTNWHHPSPSLSPTLSPSLSASASASLSPSASDPNIFSPLEPHGFPFAPGIHNSGSGIGKRKRKGNTRAAREECGNVGKKKEARFEIHDVGFFLGRRESWISGRRLGEEEEEEEGDDGDGNGGVGGSRCGKEGAEKVGGKREERLAVWVPGPLGPIDPLPGDAGLGGAGVVSGSGARPAAPGRVSGPGQPSVSSFSSSSPAAPPQLPQPPPSRPPQSLQDLSNSLFERGARGTSEGAAAATAAARAASEDFGEVVSQPKDEEGVEKEWGSWSDFVEWGECEGGEGGDDGKTDVIAAGGEDSLGADLEMELFGPEAVEV